MGIHALQDDPGKVDEREVLLEAISTIREEVTSLKTAMRGVLRENVRLKEELGVWEEAADSEPAPDDGVAQLNRVRQEVDELVRLYDAASSKRPARAPRRMRHEVAAPAQRGDRLRAMMMMMMMSELL